MNKTDNTDPHERSQQMQTDGEQTRVGQPRQGEDCKVGQEQKRMRYSSDFSSLSFEGQHEHDLCHTCDDMKTYSTSLAYLKEESKLPAHQQHRPNTENDTRKEDSDQVMSPLILSSMVDADLSAPVCEGGESQELVASRQENCSSLPHASAPIDVRDKHETQQDNIWESNRIISHVIIPSTNADNRNQPGLNRHQTSSDNPTLTSSDPTTGSSTIDAYQALSMSSNMLALSNAHLVTAASTAGMFLHQNQWQLVNNVGPLTAFAMFPPHTTQAQLMWMPGGITNNKIGPLLYISTDDDVLSDNQIVLRKQIEFFEASFEDVGRTTSGRRHPILLNQVGIQCRHCSNIPARYRQKGAIYYPAKLTGIYQAAQNMSTHLTSQCQHVDSETKRELQTFQKGRSAMGHGGKQYWADTAKAQGIVESEDGGLRFSTMHQQLM